MQQGARDMFLCIISRTKSICCNKKKYYPIFSPLTKGRFVFPCLYSSSSSILSALTI